MKLEARKQKTHTQTSGTQYREMPVFFKGRKKTYEVYVREPVMSLQNVQSHGTLFLFLIPIRFWFGEG